MSPDILSLLMTSLNLLMLVAFFAVSWTSGKLQVILISVGVSVFLIFVFNHVLEGNQLDDYSVTVDRISITAAYAIGSFLVGRLIELVIRTFLLRGRQDPE